jgi:hypothetical protein
MVFQIRAVFFARLDQRRRSRRVKFTRWMPFFNIRIETRRF